MDDMAVKVDAALLHGWKGDRLVRVAKTEGWFVDVSGCRPDRLAPSYHIPNSGCLKELSLSNQATASGIITRGEVLGPTGLCEVIAVD